MLTSAGLVRTRISSGAALLSPPLGEGVPDSANVLVINIWGLKFSPVLLGFSAGTDIRQEKSIKCIYMYKKKTLTRKMGTQKSD